MGFERSQLSPGGRQIRFPKSRVLREMKKQMQICINGRLDRQPGKNGVVHGPPVTKGGKCQHCVDIHRRGRIDIGAQS